MKVQVAKNRVYQSSKMQIIKKCLVIISIIVFIAACKKPGGGAGSSSIDCSGVSKTYSADISPIIQTSCGGCHGAGSSNGPGELTSYSRVFNARAQIRSAVSSGAMPKNGTLTAAQKNAILCWIDNGALNN